MGERSGVHDGIAAARVTRVMAIRRRTPGRLLLLLVAWGTLLFGAVYPWAYGRS